MKKVILILTVMIVFILSLFAINEMDIEKEKVALKQAEKRGDKPTLDQYYVHFNGRVSRTARTSADRIMKLDNNGEILLACIEGKTSEQLKNMGIQFLDSQMRLLIDWRLLEFDKNIYKTAIPIYGEKETVALRNILKAGAGKIATEMHSDLTSLRNELREAGKENHAFILLYSYIFHDLFWRQLKEDDFYIKPELSVESPFWSGTLWAVYPPPEFSLGTLAIPGERLTLFINTIKGDLSQKAKSIIEPFSQLRLLLSLHKDISKDMKVDDAELRTTFAPYGIFNSQGKITTPVVYEKSDNKLFIICKKLAQKYHDELLSLVDSKVTTEKLSVNRKHDAVLITFYDLKWILLDKLEKEGVIGKPKALKDPENISPADIGDLIFMAESNTKK